MFRINTRPLLFVLAILAGVILASVHEYTSLAAEKSAAVEASGPKSNATEGKSIGGEKGADKGKTRPAPVLVADAIRGSAPILLQAIGSVQAGATVEIKARINGELQKVHFTEGQDVKKGDPLFTIDPRGLEAAVREAKANLDRSRAQLRKAEEDKRRFDDLLRQQIISRDQQETTATSLAVLQSQIRADEAALESAQVQLSYAFIRSPMDGRTGAVQLHAGNMVKANDDVAMVVIQQVEPVDVRFTVPEAHLPAIMERMAAGSLKTKAAAAGYATTEEGTLTFIDNSVDPKTGTIALKAGFANQNRHLWPGQFVNVTLELGTRDNVVLVPSQAVTQGSEGEFVYILKPDSTVEYRIVTTGESRDGKTIIQTGLSGGEKVVVDGHLRLSPGAAAEVRGGGQGNATVGSKQ